MIWEIFLTVTTFIILKIWIDLVRGEAIFVPLPKNTIRKMLKMAKVTSKDLIYDLGCGDGRVLIIAAKEFGAKAVGIEKNWILFKIAKWKIEREDRKSVV